MAFGQRQEGKGYKAHVSACFSKGEGCLGSQVTKMFLRRGDELREKLLR